MTTNKSINSKSVNNKEIIPEGENGIIILLDSGKEQTNLKNSLTKIKVEQSITSYDMKLKRKREREEKLLRQKNQNQNNTNYLECRVTQHLQEEAPNEEIKSSQESVFKNNQNQNDRVVNPKLEKIRNDLDNVKGRLNNPNIDEEELDKLETRLTLIITDLDKVKDNPLTEEQRQLYREIHSYFDRLDQLNENN